VFFCLFSLSTIYRSKKQRLADKIQCAVLDTQMAILYIYCGLIVAGIIKNAHEKQNADQGKQDAAGN
jgi:hypothetical protein